MTYTIKHEDWRDEAVRRYGDLKKIKFKCPVCGYVATPEEWKKYGGTDGQIGFSCVGRLMPAPERAFGGGKKNGGPCDYAGGGLIRLNPVTVELEEGGSIDVFDFADDPLVKEGGP